MENIKNEKYKGFGKVIRNKNGELKGVWTEKDLLENEYDNYLDIIKWCKDLQFMEKKDRNNLKIAKKKLKDIYFSDTYEESRKLKYRRVMPKFL